MLLEQGDAQAAGKPIATALATETKLVAKDPANAGWRSNLTEAQLEAARLARLRKQRDSAKQLALQADATIQKLLAANSPKAATLRIKAAIEILLGQLAADSGDLDAAMKYRRQALMRMQPLASHSTDPRTLSIWVDALLATGDKGQAQPTIETLRKMGYRLSGFVARLRNQGIDYPVNAEVDRRIAQIMKPVAAAAATPVSPDPVDRASLQDPRRKP